MVIRFGSKSEAQKELEEDGWGILKPYINYKLYVRSREYREGTVVKIKTEYLAFSNINGSTISEDNLEKLMKRIKLETEWK